MWNDRGFECYDSPASWPFTIVVDPMAMAIDALSKGRAANVDDAGEATSDESSLSVSSLAGVLCLNYYHNHLAYTNHILYFDGCIDPIHYHNNHLFATRIMCQDVGVECPTF